MAVIHAKPDTIPPKIQLPMSTNDACARNVPAIIPSQASGNCSPAIIMVSWPKLPVLVRFLSYSVPARLFDGAECRLRATVVSSLGGRFSEKCHVTLPG